MQRGKKHRNAYMEIFTDKQYKAIPKSVFAAIAASFAFLINEGHTDGERAKDLILREWEVLNSNGIIPQKPMIK